MSNYIIAGIVVQVHLFCYTKEGRLYDDPHSDQNRSDHCAKICFADSTGNPNSTSFRSGSAKICFADFCFIASRIRRLRS